MIEKNLLLSRLRLNQYMPHPPSVKQAAFLLLDCREAMYGGAAGGGKSEALLSAAAQYVDCSDYAAVIFRRSFADLEMPDALIDRSKKWFAGTAAKYNELKHRWTFPSGATITFAHLKHERHLDKYQGAAFHFIGFDELTQFEEAQYLYLFSRNRKKNGELNRIPLRMRAASNPGGIGHEWVKERFIINGWKNGIVFIPATVEDNPALDTDSYYESLDKLDEITKKQLRYGDWDVMQVGGIFKPQWFKYWDVLPESFDMLIQSWDLAFARTEKSSFVCGDVWGRKGGNYFLVDQWRARADFAETEKAFLEFTEKHPEAYTKVIERKANAEALYSRLHNDVPGIILDTPTRDKQTRAFKIQPFFVSGNVFIPRPELYDWVKDWKNEITAFPFGVNDDRVDTMSQGINYLYEHGRNVFEILGRF